MTECTPLGGKRAFSYWSQRPRGWSMPQLIGVNFLSGLSTAEPSENRKIKQDNLHLSVCLSVSGDKKRVTRAVCAVPLPLTYFPLCACRSSRATLIRVLSALLRPNPCICSES